MNTQQTLPCYSDFELATAEQLCLERNRDTPNDSDFADAVNLSVKWNNWRIKNNLRPWQ